MIILHTTKSDQEVDQNKARSKQMSKKTSNKIKNLKLKNIYRRKI